MQQAKNQVWDYQGKKIAIIGLGKSGLSCVNFFQQRYADTIELTVMDTRLSPTGLEQLPETVNCLCGELQPQILCEQDLIVISPGLAIATPAIQIAIQAGVEVIGDIELFCREAKAPIIAITGSNGKSTVTTLVNEMALADGKIVGMGGNIGIPALSLLEKSCDLYVLELSSFQLETTYSLHAAASTILNLSEDHMDRYSSYSDYQRAKQRIYRNSSVAVINSDDPMTEIYGEDKHTVKEFRRFGINGDYHLAQQDGKSYLAFKNKIIIAEEEVKLVGQHNMLNALSAIALCEAVGIRRENICLALRNFSGLKHRFQVVSKENGITWINDSKATNIGSTLAALSALKVEGSLHLLMGGDGKGADFSILKEHLDRTFIKIYCFGKDGSKLAEQSSNSQLFSTMQQAVAAIKDNLNPGDLVSLSPACASLDQFKNFEERGDVFMQLAQGL